MQSKLEKITPKKATEYLAQNFCNRPISPPTRQKYVRLIQTGKFYVTHHGVAFDEQGRLRDGQHRLAAIVEADTPVTMMVARGLTEEAALAIDDGRKRTDAHALSMAHGSLISGFVTAIAKEFYMTLQVATDNETDACGQRHTFGTMARLAQRAVFLCSFESAKEFVPGRATYHRLLLRARRGECLLIGSATPASNLVMACECPDFHGWRE